jgi:hypothetical protein
MSWCARMSMGDRLASIAAIVLFVAGASAAAAGPDVDQSAGDTAATPSSVKPAPRPTARVRTGGSLQHRVDVLSKALQLDARQRTELLAILESQRQAVSKIWSDPALLPAERTPATRAVQERTADQIRSILSEEQRQRYNPPKPQGAAPPSPDVDAWMQKQAQARQQQ